MYGIATSGQGVLGTSTGGPGVEGSSANGIGVKGTSTNTYGVSGTSVSATGVYGSSSAATGTGVRAVAPTGFGLYADTSTGTAVWAHATNGTQLFLDGATPPPPSSSTARFDGSVVLDTNYDLWLSIVGGTPGLWRRISGTNTAGALTLLASPVRVYDSRPGNPPSTLPKTPLANGATRDVDCTINGSGVPVGATGVLVNLTVVNTSANGFLAAFKKGVPVPNASTLNWFQPGSIVANTTVVACDATGKISCYVPPTSSADVFVDIIGYHR
ncbi:MAG: hypothetical protein R2726_02115 [Acidimicrobiales bacterium]